MFVFEPLLESGFVRKRGDMEKSIYDSNEDGSVDLADNLAGSPLPGYYYGTDGLGTKGFYPLPPDAGGDMLKSVYDTGDNGIVDLAEGISGTTTADQYYGTDQSNVKGFYTIPVLSVNTKTGSVVLNSDDIDDSIHLHKFVTAGDLVKLGNLSGVNSGDQTTIVGISGTKNQFNTALSDGDFLFVGDLVGNIPTQLSTGTVTSTTYGITSDGSLDDVIISQATITSAGLLISTDKIKLNNTTGTNSGDQTSIVGISGNKAQFNTAVTDGDILYVGDITGNIPTDLSTGTVTSTTYGITSDGGIDDIILQQATITNAGILIASDKLKLNNTSGVNTGDQSNIVGITGTKSQFNTSVTDGDIVFVGDNIPAIQITGTKTSAFISDFATAVSSNTAVVANTAKVSNVPTDLSTGTVTSTTYGITSDGSVNDVILQGATATLAGLLIATDKAKLNNTSGINTGNEPTFTGAGTKGVVPDPLTATGKVLSDNGSWISVGGTGDMTKAVYDTNNDGKVDTANTADVVNGATTSLDYYGTNDSNVKGFYSLPAAVADIVLNNPIEIGDALIISSNIYPPLITATQNNYSPLGIISASVIYLTSNGNHSLTGLQAGVDGRVIFVSNIGSNQIKLENNHPSSLPANRFFLNVDVIMKPSNGVILLYSEVIQRWTVLNIS